MQIFTESDQKIILEAGGLISDRRGMLNHHHFHITKHPHYKKPVIEHDVYLVIHSHKITNILTFYHDSFEELWNTIQKYEGKINK